MQKLFLTVDHLDKHCCDSYYLSEDILMEHAAQGMADYIKEQFPLGSSVLIVSGNGNNGADGIALARLLYPSYKIRLFLPFGTKSPMGKKQFERLNALGIPTVESISVSDIVVDALFGSGLNRVLDEKSSLLVKELNALNAFKISCDIPSGVLQNGAVSGEVFAADITLTMGALKCSLFSDVAKDFVGDIEVISLGVDRSLYEGNTHKYLLEHKDMLLPHRTVRNAHKGNFGHCSVVSGEKEGASILAGLAAIEFGAGLVTVITQETRELPESIMQQSTLPLNTTAICAGMGMGNYYDAARLQTLLLDHEIPMVIDADLFSMPIIKEVIQKSIVITPHPKEFCTLLKVLGLADIGVGVLQEDRMHYARLFSHAYPHVVLVLKGANVIIAFEDSYYINPYGTVKLSKGGSGDVLAGLIASLLAQGYPLLDAAISGSLAHVYAAELVEKNSYAVTPNDIIKKIGKL